MTLSLEEKIGQMLIVGFHGLEPPGYLLNWLASGRIGGVILFARNIASPTQVAELTQACHAAAPGPILIAIDQEGGVVARLRDGFTESPGAMALAVGGSDSVAEQVSAVLATEMRALGINWNLAPAIDLTHNIHNPSVGVRSLGTDPQRVAQLGVAQVRGFQGAGVAATAKHFPGKADTPIDPHVSLPVIEGPLDDMWETDLVPFRAVVDAGIAAIMITHVQFKALEPDYPSTLSPRIIQGLLREKMGFAGLVSTDCMEMKAVTNTYGPGESAVQAALAGASTILFSHTRDYQEAAYNALIDAAKSGRLPEDTIDYAVSKIHAVKEQFAITGAPSLDAIRQPDRLVIVENAAQAGTVMLKTAPGVLPVRPDDARRIALVEFASALESGILEQGGHTGLAARLRNSLPQIDAVGLNPTRTGDIALTHAQKLVEEADLVILATRNAHLVPEQRMIAQQLLEKGKPTVLVCLRNPYDAGTLSGADVVLCACGDSAPSLDAAVAALLGDFVPTGQLPVPLTLA